MTIGTGRRWVPWATVCLLAIAATPGTADEPKKSEDKNPPAAKAPTAPGERKVETSPGTVHLHLEIVELRLSPEQVRRVDSSDKPIDVQLFLGEALKTGQASVKYVFDAPVAVGRKSSLKCQSRVPVPSPPPEDEGDAKRPPAPYERVGCSVNLLCTWTDPEKQDAVEAALRVEISDLVPNAPGAGGAGSSPPLLVDTSCESSAVVPIDKAITLSSLSKHRTGVGTEQIALAYVYHVALGSQK